jgi:hypothetical protein
MKMNTEDSCKGVFFFYGGMYTLSQYGDGLTEDQPPSIIRDCPVI